METIDDEVFDAATAWLDRQAATDQPFFMWFNTSHMHFRTHAKPESLGQSGRWQSEYHDITIDHDKLVGALLQKLDDLGIADNTIVMYSTDNGPHMNSWPDALRREPKVFFINDFAGKAIGIDLSIGKRPYAAFGNSNGDRQMLEWTDASDGAKLMMLIYHDDSVREYAYGAAGNLPDTKVGTFSTALMDEAKQRGWSVVSMKQDWKRIFPF